MRAVGGYFELELRKGAEYHPGAIRVNTARNAFEYLLRAGKYRKVYLPAYTCDVMREPIRKLGLACQYYHLDERLEPLFDVALVRPREAFVYTNYFGLHGRGAQRIARVCPNVIIDNAQAFYATPLPGVDAFYSPRKFFGVPDGGYLYTEKRLAAAPRPASSWHRMRHLLKRIDGNPDQGYRDFVRNERSLAGQPIAAMSALTLALLRNIDYEAVRTIRRGNFAFLHSRLGGTNELRVHLGARDCPLIYPYLRGDGKVIRKALIRNKVYVAQYWGPSSLAARPSPFERHLADDLLALPIDQRYGKADLQELSTLIGG
ncbi:MAG: hypothetical protein MUF78_00230 [Candidatus Edwardsbacteria bacterium]|nr:hypothetical protein [Candidatus Edwardsbacteria bacterium]